MTQRVLVVEMILAGFFAVACLRASVPSVPGGKLRFSDLFRLSGRLERLSRSRWQWFSMVALLLVIRLQMGLPIILEALVAIEFLVFVALPTRVDKVETKKGFGGKGNAAFVGSR